MKALLLAAGRGTRLGRLGKTTPKCLLEVGGVPAISRLMHQLLEVGVRSFLVNTHHHAEMLEEYLEDLSASIGIPISTVREPTLLGTLGTLRSNAGALTPGPVIVAHADNVLVGPGLRDFIKAFHGRPKNCLGTMMAFRADDPSECGILQVDECGVLSGYEEKPEAPVGNLANAAIYIFSEDGLRTALHSARRGCDLSQDLIPNLVGYMNVYAYEGQLVDIGRIQRWRKAQSLVCHSVPVPTCREES